MPQSQLTLALPHTDLLAPLNANILQFPSTDRSSRREEAHSTPPSAPKMDATSRCWNSDGIRVIPPKPKAKVRSATFAQIKVSDAVRNVLNQLNIVNGRSVMPMLDRKLYTETMKVLETIGAVWKRGLKCHVFPPDAEAKLADILGKGVAVNEQKLNQYYATPDHIAERMVAEANITDGCRILEPSAGEGAILSRILERIHDWELKCQITAVELNPDRAKVLYDCWSNEGRDVTVYHGDFLDFEPAQFDRIIANPPFRGGQDIEHVRHMLKILAPGGRLVTITSPSWTFKDDDDSTQFRELLQTMEHDQQELPAGSFLQSGTDVRTVLLTIDKPITAAAPVPITGSSVTLVKERSAWGKNGYETIRHPSHAFGCIGCGCDTTNILSGPDYGATEDIACCITCANDSDAYDTVMVAAHKIWDRIQKSKPPEERHIEYHRAVNLSSDKSCDVDRNKAIELIRLGLKLRTGKQWSVTGGRGTGWGWIHVLPQPKDRPKNPEEGNCSIQQAEELAAATGIERHIARNLSIAAGSDYYREYIARAWGLKPTFIGEPYWD